MAATRREFLGRFALGAAAVGGVALDAHPALAALGGTASPSSTKWDLSWTRRLTGKNRAVFDVPEVESGYGVWRAALWGKQYMEVLGAAPADLATVIVLRHNGVTLAMKQEFWDRYGIGKTKSATDPITQQSTTRNPALLSSKRGEIPAQFDGVALDQQIARGAIALACDVALSECAGLIAKREKLSDEAAHAKAVSYLVPGVILQPSGVFATVLAQQNGCAYVRAS